MDAEKLSQLTQKVIGDAAGAVGLLLAYIGDQSKVYTTMDELGPSSVKEIADKADLAWRKAKGFLPAIRLRRLGERRTAARLRATKEAEMVKKAEGLANAEREAQFQKKMML